MSSVTQFNSFTKSVKIPVGEIDHMGIYVCKGLETPLEWYNRQTKKPYLVCNCSLFSGNQPVFTFKSQGVMYIKDSLFNGLGIKGNKPMIGMYDFLDCDDFVSGAPVILENKKNMVTQAWVDTLKDISNYEPRTIFGFNDNEIQILAIDGRQAGKPGIKMSEMAEYCINAGMDNAVNFDGGYSCMTVVNGKIINTYAQVRKVYSVFAVWSKEETMEWKEPNWSWIWTKYAQVDKDGKVKVQNNDYGVAKMNAEKDGYAVWEKATKKRLYPESVIIEKPVINTDEKVFLESIKKMIDDRLNNLNG